jgi:hypothetical protein
MLPSYMPGILVFYSSGPVTSVVRFTAGWYSSCDFSTTVPVLVKDVPLYISVNKRPFGYIHYIIEAGSLLSA